MVFSRLLLAADSKNYISGAKKDDKIFVNIDAKRGEVALCFEIDDEKQIYHILDLTKNDKKCDGLIFYAKDGGDSKVICLAEMKSSDVKVVEEQIKATKQHIVQMLRNECGSHCNKLLDRIIWKACYYSYGASPSQKKIGIINELKNCGFVDIDDFNKSKNNITDFLRREEVDAKEMLARNLKKLKAKR